MLWKIKKEAFDERNERKIVVEFCLGLQKDLFIYFEFE